MEQIVTPRNIAIFAGTVVLAVGGFAVGRFTADIAPAPVAKSQRDTNRQREVAERGVSVMPFDLDATTHVFDKTASGGVQVVKADRAGDTKQTELIRAHLSKETKAFQRGNFSDPTSIHGAEMSGLSLMKEGAANGGIVVRNRDVPDGGQVTYIAKDRRYIDGIHAWFDAQVSDHGRQAENKSGMKHSAD